MSRYALIRWLIDRVILGMFATREIGIFDVISLLPKQTRQQFEIFLTVKDRRTLLDRNIVRANVVLGRVYGPSTRLQALQRIFDEAHAMGDRAKMVERACRVSKIELPVIALWNFVHVAVL